MRRLAISHFCTIALLSGCAGGGSGSGPPITIKLPCPGKDVKTGDHHVGTSKTTIRFETGGNCKFTDLRFVGFDRKDPPGFTHSPITYPSTTIVYGYDGTPIPTAGYEYAYINDDKSDGNGSGVVKN